MDAIKAYLELKHKYADLVNEHKTLKTDHEKLHQKVVAHEKKMKETNDNNQRVKELEMECSSLRNLLEKIMEIGEDCIDLNKQPKLIESVGINYLNERLRNYNIGLEDEKKIALKILHAGQFVRMFPFKIDKTPKLAAFFLNHGLDLLLDEKQC